MSDVGWIVLFISLGLSLFVGFVVFICCRGLDWVVRLSVTIMTMGLCMAICNLAVMIIGPEWFNHVIGGTIWGQ